MQKEMKREHNFKCIHCKHTDNFYESFCKTCVNKSNFECKLCKKENEKGCENCNNNAFAVKPNMQKCIGCVSPGYKNFECTKYEKESTMTNKEAIELLERDKQYTTLNSPKFIQALDVAIKALEKAYKEKPSPRMVTIKTAIEEKLMIRLNKTCLWDTGINSIISDILGCDIKYRVKYLLEPVWEVKEG